VNSRLQNISVIARARPWVLKEVVPVSGTVRRLDHGIDDNETRPDIEPARAGCPGSHQESPYRHGDHLVGNPIDMPERVDQSGPRCREVLGSKVVSELPVNPPNNVATGDIPNEQVQAVGSLIKPAVRERVPGHGAIGEVSWLGAGLESLVVPAVSKGPIPLELVTFRVGGE
jgi:hypothetical protein